MKYFRFTSGLSSAVVNQPIGVCLVCGVDITAQDFELGLAVLAPAPDYLTTGNRDLICSDCEKLEVSNE